VGGSTRPPLQSRRCSASRRIAAIATSHAWAVFKPAAEEAGVSWATPHTLRHGMASLMADQGYSPAPIAAHVGHADGGVLALRTYVHADVIDSPAS
jgi:integrase